MTVRARTRHAASLVPLAYGTVRIVGERQGGPRNFSRFKDREEAYSNRETARTTSYHLFFRAWQFSTFARIEVASDLKERVDLRKSQQNRGLS